MSPLRPLTAGCSICQLSQLKEQLEFPDLPLYMWVLCVQGQIASTGSFPAQEKGKQPRDYAESEIREITLSLTALDWGQGQK